MGFLDSLKTGLGSLGDVFGGVLGAGLGTFAQVAGGALAQNLFNPGRQAAGSPFAGIGGFTPGFAGGLGAGQFFPQQNQFGAFGPSFGQQFGPRGAFNTFPRQLQQPVPLNPLFNIPAAPLAGIQPGTPFGAGAIQAAFGGGMPAFPVTRNLGFQQAAFDLPFIDIVPQGQGALVGGLGAGGGTLTSPFRPTMAGARAQLHIQTNPVTGRPTWFRPAGQPILFSGDLGACKRVDRIARRARGSRRKR